LLYGGGANNFLGRVVNCGKMVCPEFDGDDTLQGGDNADGGSISNAR
jgi:hypothetical protein